MKSFSTKHASSGKHATRMQFLKKRKRVLRDTMHVSKGRIVSFVPMKPGYKTRKFKIIIYTSHISTKHMDNIPVIHK